APLLRQSALFPYTTLFRSAEFVRVIQRSYEEGYSFFMIEHNIDVVMKISDYITALNFGKEIAQGRPEEIQKNPEVIRAYLGSARSEEHTSELQSRFDLVCR